MPVLKVDIKQFDQAMGENIDQQALDELCFQFGIEHDGIQNNQHRLEVANNRPDLLSLQGVVSALRVFQGKEKAKIVTAANPQKLQQLIVDSSVGQVRPLIVGAILRGIKFTQQKYKSFISYQDKLHITLCRQRTLSSIGTHDLAKISPPFVYRARTPKDIVFRALNRDKQMSAEDLFVQLQKDFFLKNYLPIIKDSPVFPVVQDSKGVVCSLPPIINGQHSKITLETRDVLIEVTGLDIRKLQASLNCLVWSFSRYCQKEFTVEQVQIVYPDRVQITPNIKPNQFIVSQENINRIIGKSLQKQSIITLIQRMGLFAESCDKAFRVQVPFWRTDILHKVDVLQDVAIAYGYNNIVLNPQFSRTVGKQQFINKVTDLLRQEMVAVGYNEALNFALCSIDDLTKNLNNRKDDTIVRISNPKTLHFQAGRTCLIPGMLKVLYENKMCRLPLKFFEVGDCIIKNDSVVGSCNVRKVAAVYTDQVKVSQKGNNVFSFVHGLLDHIMQKFGIPILSKEGCQLKKSSLTHFLPEQQAQIFVKGQLVGEIGVVHPLVGKAYDLDHPIGLLQLQIGPLLSSLKS